MLSRGEDYAVARPSLTREKLRRLELITGAERRQGKRNAVRVFATKEQQFGHLLGDVAGERARRRSVSGR